MTQLQIKQANIAYRFNAPFPFDEQKLLSTLQSKKLFKKKDEPFTVGEARIGYVSNYYSKSGKTLLNYQPQEGIFGLRSTDYHECKDLFSKYKDIIFDKAGGSKEDVYYLELSSNGLFKPKTEPIKIINSKVKGQNKALFGEETFEVFGLRLYSCSENLNKSVHKIQYWSDIRFEPFILNPKYIFWEMTYRNPEEKTEKVWNNLEDLLIEYFKHGD